MENVKALVVDDEFHIVQVVAVKLRNNGFDVITAESGTKALELARSEKPDVIITDFQMPGMSGVELVQNLRKIPETTSTAVVMLTARGFAISDEQRKELEISECVSKPFSPRELLQTVKQVLKKGVAV